MESDNLSISRESSQCLSISLSRPAHLYSNVEISMLSCMFQWRGECSIYRYVCVYAAECVESCRNGDGMILGGALDANSKAICVCIRYARTRDEIIKQITKKNTNLDFDELCCNVYL